MLLLFSATSKNSTIGGPLCMQPGDSIKDILYNKTRKILLKIYLLENKQNDEHRQVEIWEWCDNFLSYPSDK